ncbi:dihydrodipicolinate synthase family protein [Amycolatopsis benzoatilytica]|uniref:dihydrodipicolinate synthase family protein n=1 Tax=Amycolatopsis benzoatilytica TaxID=346045 RepID=UPI000556956B|nr:dihydrodipicolinate synthase family protein [Amycolatopsis benzoatilytica]
MLAPGVWGVVATPFTGSALDVDEPSLARLVEHYASLGVAGLTVLGVFGEAARLDTADRRAVLETVLDSVDLPVVVGATGLSTAPVIEEVALAAELAGSRLAGAMVQVNSGDPHVLSRHLADVHEATGAGLVVQDYPLVSGVRIAPAALAAALAATPGVVAVKAEAPPTTTAIATLTESLDVPVFGGLGGLGLLDELAAGAAGAMTGFSFPEGLLACVEAWQAGGYAAAREAFLPYLPLVNFEQQATVALAVRKECLRRRGLILDAGVRPPAASLPEALREQLHRHVTAVSTMTEVA